MATQETIKQMRVSENGPLRDLEDTTARAGVSALQTALASLQSALDTLMGTEDITDEIDTYNEIKDFLDGFDVNDPTLSSQLALLNSQVNDLTTAIQNKANTSALNTAVANLQALINGKVEAVPGKGLSTNDYTNEDKAAVATIANKANSADVYTKSQTYNKSEVDAKVAIASGTYQQAVTRSQTDTGSFMWMLVDTIGGNTIRKPIFHIGNGVFVDMAGAVVEIGEVPNTPTFTMSDETSTPNEFPVGGGTVTINAGTGETIYYTTDETTPTTSSTQYTQPISVTEETTIKAIAVNRFGSSSVASETFTIAVDHKLVFKIKLTDDNSTEYVPITGYGGPKYNFTVDWGDGDTTNYYNENNGVITDKTGVAKGCGHTYNKPDAVAGKEYTITLRGSKIPILCFGSENFYNITSLVSIEDNTLECETQFKADADTRGGFYGCTSLTSLSANALQNNTWPIVMFTNTKLSSIPDGLLGNLTKSGVALTSIMSMFSSDAITATITESQMNELKTKIGACTSLFGLFFKFAGSVTIPDDMFNGLADDSVTTLQNAFWSTNGTFTADAFALYEVLNVKKTSSASVTNCFNNSSMSNLSQVPSTWK